MSLFAHIALLSWIPVVFVLFALMPARRAMLASMLGGWLFLPIAGYDLEGVPDYTKASATCVGVLLATAIFDGGRYARLRPAWYDLPVLAWCLVPLASSVNGGYGWYDGMSAALNQIVVWGIPYLIGRLYLTDAASVRELALGIVIAALVYLPLVLFEVRMSPQLHTWIYGFHQHDFGQAKRGGGWRPTVFMQHGLAVALFMAGAGLVALWLWMGRSVRQIAGVPMVWIALAILVSALLCKSIGATVLLAIGLGTLLVSRWPGTRLAAIAIIAAPIVYATARTAGGWDGRELYDAAAAISPDRAESLRVRLASETALWERVQPELVFGNGRFTFGEDQDEETGFRIVADGFWIIALGRNGLVGLAAAMGMLLLPPLLFVVRFPARLWSHPQVAPAAALAVLTVLFMLDSMFNAMFNPIYILAAGGLASFAGPRRRPMVRPAGPAGRAGPLAGATRERYAAG